MEKINEQCKWHILAPKFSTVQVFAPKCSKKQGKVRQIEKQTKSEKKQQ